MKRILLVSTAIILLLLSCTGQKTITLQNLWQGKLKSQYRLRIVKQKRFLLDSNSAPRLQYIQYFENVNGRSLFCFINKYNKTIYTYDYAKSQFVRKLSILTDKKDAKMVPEAFYIKSPDSIYVYNATLVNFLLIDKNGNSIKTISLINNKNIARDRWTYRYPQYSVQTASPLISLAGNLVFAGQYMDSLPDSILNHFKFLSFTSFNTQQTKFNNLYPKDLYGANVNWNGGIFSEVFLTQMPDSKSFLISFPISHNMFVVNMQNNLTKKIYGGSNVAGNISSLSSSKDRTTRAELHQHVMENDEYAAVLYDKYRRRYYRFLRRAAPGVKSLTYNDKLVNVVIMDEQFHFIGESTLGKLKNWYIQNAFVTKDGLNIEYLPDHPNEDIVTLKILTVEKL